VPFLFLSAHTPLMMFPALFAAAPRLEKPLENNRLLRHLSAIWVVPTDEASHAAARESA
jgi:hypothetical protein